MIEHKITSPQKSDMGEGSGHFVFSKETSLAEFLDWYSNTFYTWGIITITKRNGEILRKFDYTTFVTKPEYRKFYTHLDGWEEKCPIAEATFTYCFMNEDIEIKLI